MLAMGGRSAALWIVVPGALLLGAAAASCAGSESSGSQPGVTGGSAGSSAGGAGHGGSQGGGAGQGGTAGTSQADAGDAGQDVTAEAGPYDPESLIAIACKDDPDPTKFYELPAGLPAYDASRRGEIVRCAIVKHVTADELQTASAALFYKGDPLVSGALVVKIAYRTERLTAPGVGTIDGVTSALVFLPDKPRSGSEPQPLVVAAHGSIGIAAKCAPSRMDPTALDNHLDDAHSLYLPMAGWGWMVVAPDYAGFGYGATPAWSLAQDEAHSLLDATRAMKKMLKAGSLSGKTVIVGHSQGGHAALAAHAHKTGYGMEGDLMGVLTMAPLWLNAGAWAAALSPVLGYNTTDDKSTLSYGVDYFLGHGELYDGPGHGTDMFVLEKQSQVRDIFENNCLDDAADQLATLGAKPTDFYDNGFAVGVSTCVISGICTGSSQETWMPRFQADRPPIDPWGAPIVIWAGAGDTSITPARTKCVIDRLSADLAAADQPTTKVRVCADPTAVHSGFIGDRPDLSDGITRRAMPWVNQWIEARTMGGAEPYVCPDESALSPDPLVCETPPPNDE